jgi:hypothetical protein
VLERSRITEFLDYALNPSGVSEPTVIALNLEGRYLSAPVLLELVMPLGKAARGRTLGPLAIVLCTSDVGIREVLKALASSYDLALFVAPSVDRLAEAEALGALTQTEHETLDVVRRLGGRVTVARFAAASGLEPPAANNRLVNVQQKGFVHRIDRPRRNGSLFVDPRAARPAEDPADPTAGDYELAESVRRDVQALTEMQSREQGESLAAAWRQFFETHKDQLASDHNQLTEAIRTGNQDAMNQFAKRYTKKQAAARSDRTSDV